MKNKYLFLTTSFLLVTLLTLWAGTSLVKTNTVTAQTETNRPPEVEAFMQRVLADQHPAQDLEPMAYTPCVGGMAGPYPCDNIDLAAFIPLSTFGSGSGNSLWGWTDSLDGTEYALMGLNDGIGFVDLTDPVNPVYLGKLPGHAANSLWRDVRVYNNHAYVGSEAGGHGIQIFDLTQLRNVVSPPVTFSETGHYNGVSDSHTLAINEDTGYLYVVGSNTCNGGLHMLNIQNPTSPVFEGCFSADGYTHETQCWVYNGPDTTYTGHEICFAFNTDTVTIVDVTNKAAPVQLSRTPYSGSGYTHQGWITEDQVYLAVNDELDESNFGHNTRTRMWDVSNLDAIQFIGFHDGPTAAIDHNLYIRGNYIFESNYRAGFYILEMTDIANGDLTEEAYFDVYPSSNSASFNGTWNNYPFFESGIIIVSGIEQGLFILQPTSLVPDFNINATPTEALVCIPEETTFDITLNLTGSGNLGEVTLAASGVPDGYSAVFATNPVTPTATTALTLTNSGPAATGVYEIDIAGVSPTTTHTTTVQVTLMETPGITLTLPADGEADVPMEASFSWTAVSAGSYLLEIATDMGMTNVVYSATMSTSSHALSTANALQPSTQYYWRVTADNHCGATESTTFSFTTEAVYGVTSSPDMSGDGFVGETVIYMVWLTNTGSTTDTFDLSATGTWSVTLPTTITLASGASEMVHVLVTVPADAHDGHMETTTVTAVSQNDATATATTTLTTTAHRPVYMLYLPVVWRDS